MYHINLEGEVHPCTAKVKCRFGDFDRDHYTTVEQARAAYEAQQAGKVIAPLKKESAFHALKASERDEAAEKLQRKREFVQSLKPLTTMVPPMPERGYELELPDSYKVGSTLADGSRIVKLQNVGSNVLHVRTDFNDFVLDRDQRLSGKAWVDAAHPEELAARNAQIVERTMEDGFRNLTRLKFRLTSRVGDEAAFARARDFYESILEKNLESGVNQPYFRAYVQAFGHNAVLGRGGSTNNKGEVAFRWLMSGGAERFDTTVIRAPIERLKEMWGYNDGQFARIVREACKIKLVPGLTISWNELQQLRNEDRDPGYPILTPDELRALRY